MKLPVIVLTPVKNESWILKQFLFVTSQFADAIIIADQFSVDESREIVSSCPKTILIENPNPEYDEAYRQVLLINKARELFAGPKCLLALDADEILTASSLQASFWSNLHRYSPGTVLTFEKPDILCPADLCIRHQQYFKLGYIDDGAPHQGRKFHSVRVPVPPGASHVPISDVKFMHFALARPKEYRARQRLYSVQENLKNNSSFYHRLQSYSPRVNDYLQLHSASPTPADWLAQWDKNDINLRSLPSTELNSYNDQTLELLLKHGPSRFYLDDIWDIDWETYRSPIRKPGTHVQQPLLSKLFLAGVIQLLRAKNRFNSINTA